MDKTPAASDFVVRAKEAWAQKAWVVAPTESSYALVARANDAQALARLALAKGRSGVHPMPLVVADAAAAAIVADIPAALAPLCCLWPAPLTLALNPKGVWPQQVCAGDGTLGVRVSAHPVLAQLAAAANGPITVTSANLTGLVPALCLADIPAALLPAGCAAIDGGTLAGGPPSTVVALGPAGVRIVRQGALPAEVVHGVACPADTWSHDSLWQGRLKLAQPARGQGYRFNLDPVLLGAFVRQLVPPKARLLELGAGCGVMSLWLHATRHLARGVLLERQPALAGVIAHNVMANRAAKTLQLVCCDLRNYLCATKFSLVAFNPPYFTAHQGRPSPDIGRDQGRRECFGSLTDFVACAAGALAAQGQVATIVPASRLGDLKAAFVGSKLAITHLREVVARRGERAGRVLVLGQALSEAVQPCQVLPQLVTHLDDSRTLSAEVLPWVNGF